MALINCWKALLKIDLVNIKKSKCWHRRIRLACPKGSSVLQSQGSLGRGIVEPLWELDKFVENKATRHDGYVLPSLLEAVVNASEYLLLETAGEQRAVVRGSCLQASGWLL